MKFWPLLGTLLSLIAGSLPEPSLGEIEQTERNEPIETASSGYGIEGDGFYVWEEDRREAEDWAIELAGPAFPRRA